MQKSARRILLSYGIPALRHRREFSVRGSIADNNQRSFTARVHKKTMVSLTDVESSNSRIASTLPPGLVAIFVGATSGIGETTLKQFAKHARQPRVYFLGRSQEAADRITAECKALNAEGEYIFVKADTSLIRNVDDICRDIKSKEESVNILFLSMGTLIANVETAEGLHYPSALAIHCRTRFIVNLLPLLQKATTLRRVVSVLSATNEGPINETDLQARKVRVLAARGHGASMVTLSLEKLAERAPDVSFVHNFPGAVKTGIERGTKGAMMAVVKVLLKVIGPLIYVPLLEVGERHVFLATSARYPASSGGDGAAGVPLAGGVAVARGTTGKIGSGVYSVDAKGESAGPKVEELLAQFRKDGMREKVWTHIQDEFKRITGVESM